MEVSCLCSLLYIWRDSKDIEEMHRPQTHTKEKVSILIMCFITDSSGSACLFGQVKAANNSLIVSSFQMTGSGHSLPKLGQPVLVIIKAEVVMECLPFLLFYFQWILILLWLSQNNNCRTYLWNGWNARQLVLMMCKTNLHDSNYCDNVFNSPEAGPRDNTDRQRQCMPRPRNRLHVTDLSTLLSVQATCLSGVNFTTENGSHVTRLIT